jgi:hypothetical protein
MKAFTRSIQDRCFAAFLSTVLGFPTGWGLWMYLTLDHSHDDSDWLLKLFLHVGMDIVGALFLISVLGFVWAVCTPAWLERVFRFAFNNFIKGLAMLLVIVLVMLAIVLLAQL